MKRVVIISDLHCGHLAGLTSPDYQYKENVADYRRQKYGHNQRAMWDYYTEEIDKLKPIDVLICNGDAIDGKGEKSGGTELLEADRDIQTDMAAACLKYVEAGKIFMTYGTSYHVGTDEDWEDVVADKCNALIGGHDWYDVNGIVFNVKHHLGSSSVPYGRNTQLSKEMIWARLFQERNEVPKCDVLIRSHVHYFAASQDRQTLAISTPALQGYGSKYGVRRCSGTIDIGFIHFDILDGGMYTWSPHLIDMSMFKVEPIEV